MSLLTTREPASTALLRRPIDALASTNRFHRPLLLLSAAMAVSVVGSVVGMIVDSRVLTGLPIWDKPAKFSLSVLIYALTWSWLIPQLPRLRRTAWRAGTVAAAFLALEMVIIIGQVFRGRTSHFNVATVLDGALYSTMGLSIAVIWVATLLVTVLLFARSDLDPARQAALRAGAVIALIGMALGFMMTIPTAAQVSARPVTVAGAHTVGAADGGPGLPILGWSTQHGDLRIPHFVGMHALQLLPLLVLALELLGRRWRPLADALIRRRVILVLAAGYLGVVGLVAWQALRGQSVIRPDGLTLSVAIVLLLLAAAGLTLALRPRRVTAVVTA